MFATHHPYHNVSTAGKFSSPFQALEAKNIRILSIDGGGMRGIIPATILAQLEQALIEKTQNPATRLVDYFDFFTGTSTGGILTCLYLLPDTQNPHRPKYSAQEVLDLYTEQGPLIFERSLKRKLTSLMGFTHEKYDSRQMAKMLRHFMGETRLDQLIRPCLIPAYDISQQAAYYFTRDGARQRSSDNFAVWQVAQSTASAPVYFEPTVAQAEDGSLRTLLDGGIFANNPGLLAHSFLSKSTAGSRQNFTMVSLGTGCTARAYRAEDFRAKGILRCWKPLVHVLGTAAKHGTEQQLRLLLSSGGNQYYRLNPKLTGLSTEMDKVSFGHLAALQKLAQSYLDGTPQLLQQIANAVMRSNSKSFQKLVHPAAVG